MNKKIIWILVSSLMAISLVMVSCGPTVEEEEEEEEEEVIIGEEEEEEEEEEEKPVVTGVPQYGGQIKCVWTTDALGFDEVYTVAANALTMKLTHEEIFEGDWTKGPAGTGEFDWAHGTIRRFDLYTGGLAESWEVPELGTIIFNIRKGVHWALDPNNEASRLLGGRELTAEDVAYSLTTYCTTPRAALSYGDTRFSTTTALDKYTVECTLPVTAFDDVTILGDFASIMAPEVADRYGLPLDWENSVGTGPFMLTDYVPGNSATLIKNPDYWKTDPIGPGKGNQLPYLDGVKFLIIPDASTRLAALRTGKIDYLSNVDWEDASSILSMYPQIESKKYYSSSEAAFGMRLDKTGLPFNDKNVRRAMMMALDYELIKDEYFGGEAQIHSFPIVYMKEYSGAYLPLEEAPASVQELYVYNPDKAKKLLADAGYPDGFKLKVECNVVTADYLSIFKDMWQKVGIDIEIVPYEPVSFTPIFWGRSYEEMIFANPGPIANIYICFWYHGHLLGGNMSRIDDPKVAEAKDKMMENTIMNPPEADRINKELLKYVLDQVWLIPTPAGPYYNFWWPWIENCYGTNSLGYNNNFNFTKYVWQNAALKESMGY